MFDIYVAPTEDRASSTFWLSSTTDRGPCSFPMLNRITTISINQRGETQYNHCGETQYLFVFVNNTGKQAESEIIQHASGSILDENVTFNVRNKTYVHPESKVIP